MKYISRILAILAVALMAVSCEHDAESYTLGEQAPAGCQSMYFATTKYANTVEVEPGTDSFNVVLKRLDKSAAGTVELSVIKNEENVFVVPSTASFAAGEETTSVTITYPTAAEGIQYALVLAVVGDNVSPYTNGYREVEYNLSILKWEAIGTGYMMDGLVGNFFGVNQLPLAIEIEKTTTTSSTRYRFDSPFARLGTDKDENGGYNGYPYNEAADVVPGEYKFVIDVTKDGASLQPVNMGMDWGYGMFSCGQIYPYLSSNVGSYPLGTLKDDVITFPANSLYSSMAGYNDGGKYPCATPTYVFLNAAAYKAFIGPQ